MSRINLFNGIVNVYKPAGMTSFDVVSIMRKLTNTRKIGHTGTLDPGAEGVLVICAGEALKCVEYMINKDKEYRAQITFGSGTDTQDSTGSIINTSKKRITYGELEDIISIFQGKQKQIPPLYSAVKYKGEKYCDIVRKGLEIEKEPEEREIEIYSISIESVRLNAENLVESADIYIHCSKGTYIRTICNDIGLKAGTFANMSHLTRVRAGAFKIDDSFKIEELKDMKSKGELNKAFVPMDTAFWDCRMCTLDYNNVKRITNGIPIKLYLTELDEALFKTGEYVRIYDEDGKFRAVGKITDDSVGKLIKGYRIFNDNCQ